MLDVVTTGLRNYFEIVVRAAEKKKNRVCIVPYTSFCVTLIAYFCVYFIQDVLCCFQQLCCVPEIPVLKDSIDYKEKVSKQYSDKTNLFRKFSILS